MRDFQSSPLTIVFMTIVGLSNYPPVSIKPQGIVAVQTAFGRRTRREVPQAAGIRNPSHKQTHAPRQTSGRAFAVISFVYFSVECPFNKFYGINCCPKLDAKLLDRFFHRRRQVAPPVQNLTHRFFDGSKHFLYCNFTVGSHHSAVASSSSKAQFPNGIVNSVSFVSTTNTARSLAGFVLAGIGADAMF